MFCDSFFGLRKNVVAEVAIWSRKAAWEEGGFLTRSSCTIFHLKISWTPEVLLTLFHGGTDLGDSDNLAWWECLADFLFCAIRQMSQPLLRNICPAGTYTSNDCSGCGGQDQFVILLPKAWKHLFSSTCSKARRKEMTMIASSCTLSLYSNVSPMHNEQTSQSYPPWLRW